MHAEVANQKRRRPADADTADQVALTRFARTGSILDRLPPFQPPPLIRRISPPVVECSSVRILSQRLPSALCIGRLQLILQDQGDDAYFCSALRF